MMEALLAKYKTLLESLRIDLKRFKGSEANNYKTVSDHHECMLHHDDDDITMMMMIMVRDQ